MWFAHGIARQGIGRPRRESASRLLPTDRGGAVSHRRRSSAQLLVAIAAVSGGCSTVRTEILLAVDTDSPVTAVRNLTLRCDYDWDGVSPAPRSGNCEFLWTRGCAPAQLRLPATIGILADPARESAAMAARMITFVLEDELNPDHRRVLRAAPVRGALAGISIRLMAACGVVGVASTSHPCPATQASCTLSRSCEVLGRQRGQSLTCGDDGTCRSSDVVPSEVVVPPPMQPPDRCI